MTGKDFVVLPARTLPGLNGGYMPPGKSKNVKSVAKTPTPAAPKRSPGAKTPAKFPKDRTRVVDRSVIYNDHFNLHPLLEQDGLEAAADVPLC